MNNIRKVSRGQVWFLIDPNLPVEHYRDSVQGKNRPWLVVSNDTCNQQSPIYTVVPLTTAAKNDLPTHCKFTTEDKVQTVLCEQIRTISDKVFYNSGSSYWYTLSNELMQKVDECLAIQLGLGLVMPNAERFWQSIERMIRLKVKELLNSTKVEALDVAKVATLIDSKVEELINVDKQPVEIHIEKPVEEQSKPKVTPKTRQAWNENNKKKFLDDYYKYGVEYCMSEYSLGRSSVYSTYTRFKKEVNNAGTSEK